MTPFGSFGTEANRRREFDCRVGGHDSPVELPICFDLLNSMFWARQDFAERVVGTLAHVRLMVALPARREDVSLPLKAG